MKDTFSPTEKQINFVEEIADVLEIDFPTDSREFTGKCFQDFISQHMFEYQYFTSDRYLPDDLNDNFENDAWTEYY